MNWARSDQEDGTVRRPMAMLSSRTSPSHISKLPRASASGVSGRAILLAFILLLCIIPAAFYTEIVYGVTYEFASGVPAMAPLVLLLCLTVVNQKLARYGLRPFTRSELLTIYAIVLVGGPVSTRGIMVWLLATPMTLQYGVRTNPEWESLLTLLPPWFSPTDPASVIGFFEGHASVSWMLWVKPVLVWGSFLAALFLAALCLVLLLRRQWITYERLAFPMAQVPLELVTGTTAVPHGQPPSNRLFWWGLGVAFGLMTLTRLSQLFPALPTFSLMGPTLFEWRGIGPLAGLGAWELWIPPDLIAIAYLIPKDLSFSCWFFWLVRLGLTVIAIAVGGTPQRPEEWWSSSFPAPVYQGGGAVLAMLLWTVWVARRHLFHAIKAACSWRKAATTTEPLSYRLTLLGLVFSILYLVGFYCVIGSRVAVAVIFVFLIVVHYLVWARLRAETGLGFIPFPLIVSSMVAVPFGTAVFHPREVVALMGTRWSYFPGYGESYEVTTGNSLEALKIADVVGLSSRRLLGWMCFALLFSVAVAFMVALAGFYKYGMLNTSGAHWGWLQAMLRRNGSQFVDWTTTPQGPDTSGLFAIGAGAIVTMLLGFFRAQFWWWPFHPIGYLAANCWGMHWFAQPFFLGWMAKTLMMRYGGSSLYRKTIPFAIGLILGDLTSDACWVLLSSGLNSIGITV